MPHQDEIADLVRTGRAAFVVGAGVTIATAADSTLTWPGLIERGADRVVDLDPSKAGKWADLVRQTLNYGLEASESDSLIAAAGHVQSALNANGDGVYADWLKTEFSQLVVADEQLIAAIDRCALPVLTTNYDDLIERVTGRRGITWQDARALQQVIADRGSEVAHLHGVWHQPESVIFGGQNYGTLLGQQDAQTLQRAVGATKSLIFVGCGDGGDDPNIGGLLSSLKDLVPDSAVNHYFLHRSGEEPRGLPDNVRAVPYGTSYDDLTPFLEALAPSPEVVTGNAAATAELNLTRSAAILIIEQTRSEVLLAELVEDADTAALADLLMPPVLLPVTQQQYANSQELSPDERIRRCDLDEEVALERRMLLAAEERSGLTNTLRWLVHAVHESNPSVAPVYMDFRNLPAGKKPLRKRIVRELRQAGYSLADDGPLPRIALALDNVVQDQKRRTLDRVIEELADASIAYLVVGTRQGAEHELMNVLTPHLEGLVQRYIGRLNTSDIRALATMVAPARAKELTTRAVDILGQEHLPRTPYTICMLLIALLRGQVLSGVNSETALLDAYITLMLGAADPLQDARISLDYFDRRKLLGALAGELVRRDTASLQHEEVAKLFANFFDSVDWNEDSLDVLNDLVARRILKNGNGVVGFGHASYLHLFAAARARDDRNLRTQLFGRALYYADIIRHYVALNRDDAEALKKVAEILASASSSAQPAETGHFFGNSPEADKVLDASTVEELLASLDLGDAFTVGRRSAESGGELRDPLDTMAEEDLEPFPADLIEDAPPTFQIVAALSLVSNVLRDSESVTDLELKRDVLARTLSVWGKLVTLLETDPEFQRFIETLARTFAAETGAAKERADKFVEDVQRSAPALVGVTGMVSTLASRKLSRTLDRLFAEEDFLADAGASIMGAILSLDLGPGWAAHFLRVHERHHRRRAIDAVMVPLTIAAYYVQQLGQADRTDAEEFVAQRKLAQVKTDSAIQTKAFANQVKEELRKQRAMHAKRQLAAGQTVLRAIGAEDADDAPANG